MSEFRISLADLNRRWLVAKIALYGHYYHYNLVYCHLKYPGAVNS